MRLFTTMVGKRKSNIDDEEILTVAAGSNTLHPKLLWRSACCLSFQIFAVSWKLENVGGSGQENGRSFLGGMDKFSDAVNAVLWVVLGMWLVVDDSGTWPVVPPGCADGGN